MIPTNQPFVRDLTPNAPQEIVKRLRAVLAPVALLLGLTLATTSVSSSDGRMMIGAYGCGVVFVALLLIPKKWRTPPTRSGFADVLTPDAANHATAPASTEARAATPGTVRPRILLLNASLAGTEGNSVRLLAALETHLAPHAELRRAVLVGAKGETFAELQDALRAADAIVFATGTHWDSWSSPLQKFLEEATPAETTALWLGKPAAVLVTEHSTGGKGVLSRLQGVLVTLGCAIPPLSGLVLSQAAQDARSAAVSSSASSASRAAASLGAADYWSPEDIAIIAHNLLVAARQPRAGWRTWPVDRTDYARAWLSTAQ